jgi:hypothetical protein
MKALDLFCGAGGASMGISRAGFEVTGVDINPQPRYPFAFIQGDALEADLTGYDLVWASPPCQAYSQSAMGFRSSGKQYPDLIASVREKLERQAKAWIIENVPSAPIRPDFKLCGCQFGLKLRRERWFETSWHGYSLVPSCYHPNPVVSVVGHGTPSWVRARLGRNPRIEDYREAMGIDWMNRNELSQAIPPAYSEFLCRKLLTNSVEPSASIAIAA